VNRHSRLLRVQEQLIPIDAIHAPCNRVPDSHSRVTQTAGILRACDFFLRDNENSKEDAGTRRGGALVEKQFSPLSGHLERRGMADQKRSPRFSSQRLQELDDRYLVLALQFVELLGYISRFAAMPHDGVPECEGCAVVHHSRTEADSP
jgi:hypothetical protein